MKTKGIAYSKVKEKVLMNNDVLEVYLFEKKEEVQILPVKTKNTQTFPFPPIDMLKQKSSIK